MRVFINCCLYCAIAIILGTADIDLTSWQCWAIMVLTLVINIKAMVEED